MENEFYERGLEILKKHLPNYSIEKNGDGLLVKIGDNTLECEADFEPLFEQLFKLIDDDRLLRQQDSSEFYWGKLAKVIEQEIIKNLKQ